MESDKRCIKTIRENLGTFNAETATILVLDVFKAIALLHRQRKRFNIIFLDPPYYRGLAKKSLINLARYDILERNSLIIVEHYKRDILPQDIEGLRLVEERRYSDTLLSFYKRN